MKVEAHKLVHVHGTKTLAFSCPAGTEVNILASHHSGLGPIIDMRDGLWLPGWTGGFSLSTPVSPHSRITEMPPSAPQRMVFDKL